MQTFSEFLKDTHQVPLHCIADYVKWAQLYQQRLKSSCASREDDTVSPLPFLDWLATRHDKEQVAQARRAIQFFWYYSRQRSKKPQKPTKGAKPIGPSSSAAPIITPRAATVATPADSVLLDRLSKLMRLEHLSFRTEKTYLGWAARFLTFAGRASGSMPTLDQFKCFLAHLAVDRKVAAATQKQAFNALLYLFRRVLDIPVHGLECVARARAGKRLPVILTVREVSQILS